MVYIFHRDSDKPDQTLWSNSKVLVDKQQELFEKLWEIAVPLSIKSKELEYETKRNIQRVLKNSDELLNEIKYLIFTTRKELIVFSSNKILSHILNKNNFINHFPSLLQKGITIKILTDTINNDLINRINDINNINLTNPIHQSYSNKLGDLDQTVIISDNKRLLQIKYNKENELNGIFSNEEHLILVQEILFEKHWNEIQSLAVMQSK